MMALPIDKDIVHLPTTTCVHTLNTSEISSNLKQSKHIHQRNQLKLVVKWVSVLRVGDQIHSLTHSFSLVDKSECHSSRTTIVMLCVILSFQKTRENRDNFLQIQKKKKKIVFGDVCT
jgi:hypothetical protein